MTMKKSRFVDKLWLLLTLGCFVAAGANYGWSLWRNKRDGRTSTVSLKPLVAGGPAAKILDFREVHGRKESRVSGRVVVGGTGEAAHVRLLWYRVKPWTLLAEGKSIMPEGRFVFVGPPLKKGDATSLIMTPPNSSAYLRPGGPKGKGKPGQSPPADATAPPEAGDGKETAAREAATEKASAQDGAATNPRSAEDPGEG